jgi:hypothetical protein
MLAGSLLLLLLASKDTAVLPPSKAHAELEVCAERIEELKARGGRGAELDRLLRRAQELAAELERAGADLPAPPHAGPSPEELRERADVARDEADRLAAEMAALDVKIQDAHRTRADPDAGLQRAALGTAAIRASPHHRLHVLAAQRAALSEKRARAEAEAARLEAEARAAERIR